MSTIESVSGRYGRSVSGDYGTAISGDHGESTSGRHGTSTTGYGGIAAAGEYGQLHIQWYDSERPRTAVAYVGENGIKANTPYRLDDNGNFVEVTDER